MRRHGFADAGALIHHLLDRHEASEGATRPSAPIDVDSFGDVADRDAFDAELARLEAIGAVHVVRSRSRFDPRATGVRLADAATAYLHVGREPSGDAVDAALADLRADGALASGERELLDEVASAWRRGVSGLGLTPGDATGLRHVLLLARALRLRKMRQEYSITDYRTFSRHAVGDSKALERNLRQVAATLSRGDDWEGTGTEAPEDVLDALGVTRMPQPVLAGGPLATAHGALPPLAFVGVPAEDAASLVTTARPTYVLIVENYASFVRHAREVARADGSITIYSGGFPSRPALAAILSLSGQAGAPTFHWGDMDGGGVRIFRHLELALSEIGVSLRPHLMSVDLLEAHGTETTTARTGLVGNFAASAVEQLAGLIAESGLSHEQEEFDPVGPAVSDLVAPGSVSARLASGPAS